MCSAILELLDPKTSDGESKVIYQKMKADYYRHIAEFTTDDAKILGCLKRTPGSFKRTLGSFKKTLGSF